MQEISAGGVVFRRIRGKVELLLIEDFHLPRAADVRIVRRTIRQLQERSVRVQTRGLYHDIGPSISHKAWIVGLHLEYKTYSEIARTTRHSTASIKRYIRDFARVVLCSQRGLSLPETAYSASISERLAGNTQGFICATTAQNTLKEYKILSSRWARKQQEKNKKGARKFHVNG